MRILGDPRNGGARLALAAGAQQHRLIGRQITEGFFFEIVQRDGYIGYGAPNAGIRLAAQARATGRAATRVPPPGFWPGKCLPARACSSSKTRLRQSSLYP